MTFDYKNRPVGIGSRGTGQPVALYLYFADNRRAEKQVYSQAQPAVLEKTTRFFWAGWQCVEEQDAGTGSTETTYVWGAGYIDELCQVERTAAHPLGAARLWVHCNVRLDVVAVTDASGAKVESRRYDDFGNAEFRDAFGAVVGASPSGLDYGFQGRRLDPESGLLYFRHRYYDPELGRFVQRDPVWDAANVGGWYSFVGNGAASRSDPFGLKDDWKLLEESWVPGWLGSAVALTNPITAPMAFSPIGEGYGQTMVSLAAEAAKSVPAVIGQCAKFSLGLAEATMCYGLPGAAAYSLKPALELGASVVVGFGDACASGVDDYARSLGALAEGDLRKCSRYMTAATIRVCEVAGYVVGGFEAAAALKPRFGILGEVSAIGTDLQGLPGLPGAGAPGGGGAGLIYRQEQLAEGFLAQSQELSCGAAAGGELIKSWVQPLEGMTLEDAVLGCTGPPYGNGLYASDLGAALTTLCPEGVNWVGGGAAPVSEAAGAGLASAFIEEGGSFMALLKKHWVIVDEVDFGCGLVRLRDPAPFGDTLFGSTGEMTIDQFNYTWKLSKHGVVKRR